jgi:hypothetical protein
LGAFCDKGKLTFLESVSKDDSFNIHHEIQWRKSWFLDQGNLKWFSGWVSWPIFIIFWDWTLKCNEKRIVSLTQKCESNKYVKLYKGKWDSRNETRKRLRNETKFYFWRNKTKRNEISLFIFDSRNKRNFAKQFFVSLCFVFRETKKRMRNGNPKWKSADFLRNLQQFGIRNVSEEWKSADFLRNLQQFGTKNPRNGNNSFTAKINFFKNWNTQTSLKWKINLIRPYYELHIYRMNSKMDTKISWHYPFKLYI